METTATPPVVIAWQQPENGHTHQLRIVYDESIDAVTVTASELRPDGSGRSAIWEVTRDDALNIINLLVRTLNPN